MDLHQLELRLQIEVPRAYRAFVESTPDDALVKQGFDPKTLLILNLELAGIEWFGNIRQRFFLNGDGCGNYYFVNLAGDENELLLWSHDPPGIETTGLRLAAYLPDAVQEQRIDFPIAPGILYVARTSAYAESILDPIDWPEWLDAVSSTAGLKYLGHREFSNPFTGELMRVEAPSQAEVVAAKGSSIHLFCGRILLDDSPITRPIAVTLAQKLNANVLDSTSKPR